MLRASGNEGELREQLLSIAKRRILIKDLKYTSSEVRKWIYKILKEAKSGHLGGPLSSVELLTTLYFGGILRYDPNSPKDPNRDRVLMRGHLGPLHYPILSMAGFFPESKLFTYRKYGTSLPGHEDYRIVPGVDMTPSGSLGMLLSYGTGSARIAKIENRPYKVYTFLGDGEEQEGNVAEAARNAAHLKLDNLICIIDKNAKQLTFPTKQIEGTVDLRKLWEGYGWNVIEIEDGHNINEILNAYGNAYYKDKPTLIIANTIKGKGVPGIEQHKTGVHSGRELEGFGYNWDDMLKIEQAEQDKIGDVNYAKFIKDAISSAMPVPALKEQQFTAPQINIKVDPNGNYDNMVKALQNYFEMLNAELEKNGKPFNIHSLSADFLPSFRVKPDTLSQLGSYVDVGLKEQHMVAMAHGMSVTDPKSRVVVMVGDEFLYRAADQIHVCAQGDGNVIFITCDAGICGSFNGPTHQSSGQPGIIATMPRITMLEPADVYDLYDCLNWAMTESKGPVYIRTHVAPMLSPIERYSNYDTIRGYNVVFEPSDKVKPDVIVVASGFPVGSAIAASKLLVKEEIHIRVINVTNPKILNEGFVNLLEDSIPVLTVYNGNPTILESFVTKAILENPVKKPSLIKGHGFDYGGSGSILDLMKHFKMDAEGLVEVIRNVRHSASGVITRSATAIQFNREINNAIGETNALFLDLININSQQDLTYTIKYDEQLKGEQEEIIHLYGQLLSKKANVKVEFKKHSKLNGSKESLISVYCTGRNFSGEGHVDINIPEGEIGDYLLRIIEMLNIATASANIPSNLSKEDIDKYRPIVSYIKNQYKSIIGEELAVPDSPEDILKVIRKIVLGLPKSMRTDLNQIEEYNRLAKEALVAA
jgi:transketolase